MVLEDTAAPVLTGLKVNGKPRPVSTDILDLGCMSGTDADVVLGVKDDLNPLMASPGLLAAVGSRYSLDRDRRKRDRAATHLRPDFHRPART